MMQLQLQDFPTLIRNQAAAVAASCRTLVDVSVGSVLRAVLEANASVALWMQWLIMEVLALTRAATSYGSDLDSWVADFGMARLPAVAAGVSVRFSRVTPGLATVVPVGAIIRTGAAPNGPAFYVSGDPSQPTWNGGGYVLQASATDLVVPAQSVLPGVVGNVGAAVLTVLSTTVPGVDSVTNDLPAHGGLDAESDAALRSRFSGFLDSRTRATAQAVSFAIQSVQQGLQFRIAEQLDPSGAFRAGHFTVVLDDGSGSPSDALVGAVGAAIEGVRAIGSTYSVVRPQLIGVNVTLRVTGGSGAPTTALGALAVWLQSLPIGTQIFLSKISQIVHESDPSIVRVFGLTVNGQAADLEISQFARPVPGQLTVTA